MHDSRTKKLVGHAETLGLDALFQNEPIYESWEVKRAGAEILGREFPHIPFTFGFGRSGLSPTSPLVRVRALPIHIL